VTLFLGAFFFAIQIYCDFSGYTDIALGSAKLLGFELKKNFDFPYFSRNIAEFWRRWHISLSNWFRDYLYIPIGGSRCGKRRTIINILVTFTLCGLWHGANWTFVAWGFLNGLLFIPLILMNKHQVPEKVVAHGKLFPSLREVVAMAVTFVTVLAGWVFFRALNMTVAIGYLKTVVTTPYLGLDYTPYILPLSISLAMLAVEWLQRHQEHGLANLRMPMIARYAMYYGLVIALVELGGRHDVPFIYFQF
jgi:alginate O-acetyltransferase complex protein AlgI